MPKRGIVWLRDVEAKRCPTCGEYKPLDMYCRNRSGRGGLGCYCKDCERKRSANRRQEGKNTVRAIPDTKQCSKCGHVKPGCEFSRNTASPDGLVAHCKLCALDYAMRKSYGITLDDYMHMFEHQAGRCAVCSNTAKPPMPGQRFVERLVVDHDHATGTVRGLLCDNCNRALGLVHDSEGVLLAAVDYLRSHKIVKDNAA